MANRSVPVVCSDAGTSGQEPSHARASHSRECPACTSTFACPGGGHIRSDFGTQPACDGLLIMVIAWTAHAFVNPVPTATATATPYAAKRLPDQADISTANRHLPNNCVKKSSSANAKEVVRITQPFSSPYAAVSATTSPEQCVGYSNSRSCRELSQPRTAVSGCDFGRGDR